MVPVSSTNTGVPVTTTASVNTIFMAISSPDLYVPSAVSEPTETTVGPSAPDKVVAKLDLVSKRLPAASVI